VISVRHSDIRWNFSAKAGSLGSRNFMGRPRNEMSRNLIIANVGGIARWDYRQPS
jgi:hypothetical protein